MGFVAQATIRKGLGIAMKNYVVLVDFAGESISLSAKDNEEAIRLAKDIITEEYGDSVADDATFKVSA
jgi:multidrug efflux pump subunit AcrB